MENIRFRIISNEEGLEEDNSKIIYEYPIDTKNIEIYHLLNLTQQSALNFGNFTHLKKFIAYNTGLFYLPPLPDTVEIIRCNYNKISHIAHLPPRLKELEASFNQYLQICCLLPPTLKYLYCNNCDMRELPYLLNTRLEILNCSFNQFTVLPVLPYTLTYLDCNSNNLIILPRLPKGLIHLSYSHNSHIRIVTTYPLKLETLHCSNTGFTNAYPLPSTLKILSCGGNGMRNLHMENIPITLTSLDVRNNLLEYLDVSAFSLLEELNCSYNELRRLILPTFPEFSFSSFNTLDCSNNALSKIYTLPSEMFELNISYNRITHIPHIPDMEYCFDFQYQGNPITCILKNKNNQLNHKDMDTIEAFRSAYYGGVLRHILRRWSMERRINRSSLYVYLSEEEWGRRFPIGGECGICWDDSMDKYNTVYTICSHRFCKGCICGLLRYKGRNKEVVCPLCREGNITFYRVVPL